MLKAIFLFTCLIGAASAVPAAEIEDTSEYIGSSQCGTCHPDEYESWKSSRHAEGSEDASQPNQTWIENCSGCHTTGMTGRESAWKERGVGCEACHGPGSRHVSDLTDKSKIVSTVSADVCGRCHGGNPSGGGLMADGTKWVVGFRPGMKLSDIAGLEMPDLDPSKLPPAPVNNHPPTYNMWKASKHSKTPDRTFKIGGKEWSGPITCVACHNPHQSENPHQLVMDPKALCSTCHPQDAVLKGIGARGIEQTRSLHTAIPCISCHMTEGNHLMAVLRPDNPDLPADRFDSCSACHEVKDREARTHQLHDWEAWYRESMEPVQADMRIVDEALKMKPDLLNNELKKKLEDTKFNLSILEQDGSGGAHNLDYALEILSLAKRDLAKIKAALQ